MHRSSLVPMLAGLVLVGETASSALAQSPRVVASQAPSVLGSTTGTPVVSPVAAGAVTTTSAGSVATNCVPAADAPKPKHRGFGSFVKGMVRDHGVQALEIATGVGAVSMMSKSMTSMAVTNGMQAMAAQQQTAALARQNTAMSGMANVQTAMLAGRLIPGAGGGASAAAMAEAAQVAAMQTSAGSPVANGKAIVGQGGPASSAPANCANAASVSGSKAGAQ